jgi:hypothetical protein
MDLTQRVWPKAHAQSVLVATLALGTTGDMAHWVALLRREPLEALRAADTVDR